MKKIISMILAVSCGATAVFSQEDAPVMFNGQQDTVSYTAYSKIDKDRLVGAVSVVTGEELRRSHSPNVQTALASQALGFYSTSWNIRSSDTPLVIIDGMRNREMSSITTEEVENVYILRDATAKILYGSEAADGVIVIETRHGKEGKPVFKANLEYGMQFAHELPEYLNSYDYAVAYNQARTNDGLTAYYSDEQLQGYLDGTDLLTYPDNDMYDIFLNDYRTYRRANMEYSGTVQDVAFFFDFGYYGDSSIIGVGTNNDDYNRLNVRSNVSYKVNNVVSIFADVAARWDMTDSANLTASEVIAECVSLRPNDAPLFVGSWGDTDSLGYSSTGTYENLYGELTRTGYTYNETVFAQMNIGTELDLNSITKGLTARGTLSYDAYTQFSKGQTLEYASYQVQTDGSLLRIGTDDVAGSESLKSNDIWRNFGSSAQLNYDRTFDKHSVLATALIDAQILMPRLYDDTNDELQDNKSVTAGLRVNYAYDGRYVLELDGTMLGSDKFAPGNRWGAFGAVGGAWNMHKESFMEDVDFINKLKLKASYGVMGYDRDYSYMLYETLYDTYGAGTLFWGEQNAGGNTPTTAATVLGNEELTFETATEMNVGFEANFLNNRLMVEANYFTELREGIPVQATSVYPDYYGFGDSYPWINYNSTSTKGYEVGLSWGERRGDFSYRVGATLLHTSSKYEVYDQDSQLYDYQVVEGRYIDAITGYVSNGLYQNQDQIDSYGVTSSFATLVPGDIMYLDQNDDGVINSYDIVVLDDGDAHSQPRYTYTFNLNMQYKNWSLYALGYGLADYTINGTWCSYFYSTGTNKYSAAVLGAAVLDEATGSIQADATYPRLTTATSGHSFSKNSDYWMYEGGYFRLKSVQLTYSLPQHIASKIKAGGVDVYLKGENLFSHYKSDIADGLEASNIWAGITGNPTFTTVAVGLDLTF